MPEQLRVAVIGAGNMGRHHARLYRELGGVKLVAVADPDPGVAALARSHGAVYYGEYERMLEIEVLDAVSIATPTHLHAPIGSLALLAGLHVLVEKPLAGTPAEAEGLVEAARSSESILTVGHVERFNPAVRKLREIVDSGALGAISSLSSRRVGGFPSYQPATDVVLDLAIHDIDVMSMLLGERPRVLAAHGSRTYHPLEIDSAEILLGFGSASGLVQANWITPIKVRTLAATGSRGHAEMNYITQEVRVFEHQAVEEYPTFESFVSALGEPTATVYQDPLVEPLRMELEAFVKAALGGDRDQLMTAEAAWEAVVVASEALDAL